MNRSQQIRAIYAVLKDALGHEFSAGDLLRSAAALLQAIEEPELEVIDSRFGPHEPFFAIEVDKAMQDGGWRVLDFERRCGMALLDEMPENAPIVRRGIERLVGKTEWPRNETV